MSSCKPSINNPDLLCPPDSNWSTCRPWDLQSDNVNCLSTSYVDDTLNIGGANLNIYKLLGVHEQNLINDQYLGGTAISGGDDPRFQSHNAFTKSRTAWRSKQRGAKISDSFIGYDFGEILLDNGRKRYGIEANKRVKVNSVKIKQSANPTMRIKRARIERSEDGKTWYGCSIIQLLDNDALNTYAVNNSVPSRYWRIRPTSNMNEGCVSWEVQAIEFLEHEVTNINNIQDMVWLENRSRDYMTKPIGMKCFYSPLDTGMDLTRMGIRMDSLMGRYTIRVSFNQCLQILGRPVVVGDILELPSEAMLSHNLTTQRLYLEVTSVGWDAASMTHGWQHTMLLLQTTQAVASEETQDIFGDLVPYVDNAGLSNIFDGTSEVYQDMADVSQTIYADSNTAVPERGLELSGAWRQFDEDDIEKIEDPTWQYQAKLAMVKAKNTIFVEDGMPPNGIEYTEGPEFPDNPSNKDYHRLTYIGNSVGITTKLYRFSDVKNRWIYMSSDRREEMNNQRNTLTEYLGSSTKVDPRKLGKDYLNEE